VVDLESWVAGGLSKAHDGRGEITGGKASGPKQRLTLRDSVKRWGCKLNAK
jgi:hypothetical protein